MNHRRATPGAGWPRRANFSKRRTSDARVWLQPFRLPPCASNSATPRHAQQYNATVPGQAYTSAYSSPMPSARKPRSKEADLQALSISQLKRVARERRIDTSHCFEKADLIAALRPPPLPPPASAAKARASAAVGMHAQLSQKEKLLASRGSS